MNNIRLFKPFIGNEELKEINKAFKKSWIGYGPTVKKFENLWCKKFNVKYSIATNSCTAALHVALKSYNFKKNKKVLVPSITFSATAAVVLYCDLQPIFVDIDKNSLTMSFEDLKKKYTKDCVAIMPVHFGGHPCEMEKIVPWAKKRNLKVIEDCAHTCGGTYKGKKLGTWGDFGCFSFEEKKMLTTGDGGMVVTNNKKKNNLIRSLSFHGWDKDPLIRHKKSFKKKHIKFKHWDYQIKNLGFKYNMNDLMASIGIIQIKKINLFNFKRRIIVKKYLNGLKACKGIIPAFPYKLKQSSYWLFSIRCKKRDYLMSYLKKKKISTSIHLKPLPLHPIYRKYKSSIPNAKKVWKELLTLPFYPDLSKKNLNYIIKQVKIFDEKYL